MTVATKVSKKHLRKHVAKVQRHIDAADREQAAIALAQLQAMLEGMDDGGLVVGDGDDFCPDCGDDTDDAS